MTNITPCNMSSFLLKRLVMSYHSIGKKTKQLSLENWLFITLQKDEKPETTVFLCLCPLFLFNITSWIGVPDEEFNVPVSFIYIYIYNRPLSFILLNRILFSAWALYHIDYHSYWKKLVIKYMSGSFSLHRIETTINRLT